MNAHADIAIIGGSGIYDVTLFEDPQEIRVETPFGLPSDDIVVGEYKGTKICFLARHGKGHRISPSDLNYRANIYALKKMGVRKIIAASAVGSLNRDIAPLDMVIPDQLYDRTNSRKSTFFEDGIVVHMGFADPFCPGISEILYDVMVSRGYIAHKGGTYVCIEGPQFSTRAESRVYQSLGFDIIGMTALPEAKLAREAEICYSMISTVTDYDVWRDEEVNIGSIMENVAKNTEAVKDIIACSIDRIQDVQECTCQSALDGAITTDTSLISYETSRRLDLLIGKYMEE